MVKNELVLETLMIIKEDVGAIKQHLVTLNGSVKRHEGEIKDNEKNIIDLKVKQYWMIGIGLGSFSILGLIFGVVRYML